MFACRLKSWASRPFVKEGRWAFRFRNPGAGRHRTAATCRCALVNSRLAYWSGGGARYWRVGIRWRSSPPDRDCRAGIDHTFESSRRRHCVACVACIACVADCRAWFLDSQAVNASPRGSPQERPARLPVLGRHNAYCTVSGAGKRCETFTICSMSNPWIVPPVGACVKHCPLFGPPPSAACRYEFAGFATDRPAPPM